MPACAVMQLACEGAVGAQVPHLAGMRAPRHQLFEMARRAGLKMQVVLSFHACGGNEGDGGVRVPLPQWVLAAGERDPDLWFTDAPRADAGHLGRRNRECISLFADHAPPKAPVTCSDPDDQKFIDLAVARQALLLSKDRAVLSMKKRLLAWSVRAQAALETSP